MKNQELVIPGLWEATCPLVLPTVTWQVLMAQVPPPTSNLRGPEDAAPEPISEGPNNTGLSCSLEYISMGMVLIDYFPSLSFVNYYKFNFS